MRPLERRGFKPYHITAGLSALSFVGLLAATGYCEWDELPLELYIPAAIILLAAAVMLGRVALTQYDNECRRRRRAERAARLEAARRELDRKEKV